MLWREEGKHIRATGGDAAARDRGGPPAPRRDKRARAPGDIAMAAALDSPEVTNETNHYRRRSSGRIARSRFDPRLIPSRSARSIAPDSTRHAQVKSMGSRRCPPDTSAEAFSISCSRPRRLSVESAVAFAEIRHTGDRGGCRPIVGRGRPRDVDGNPGARIRDARTRSARSEAGELGTIQQWTVLHCLQHAESMGRMLARAEDLRTFAWRSAEGADKRSLASQAAARLSR